MSESEKRRVLVTGGSGLVGHGLQNVATFYPEIEFIFASSKDGDLRDANQTKRMLQNHAPLDGVIHCAANVGGLFKNMREPVTMMEDNLLMNTNILREAHQEGIQNVLCVLSTCIFPDAHASSGVTLTSEMLHDGPPHFSNEGYAYAKRMMEVLCRAYQRQHNRRYFCVVPTNIYGPHDNFNLENAHVLPALIQKASDASFCTSDRTFVVAGDGSPLRQFIYVDDLAHLMIRTYLRYQDISTPRILCPPNAEYTIAHVAKTIAKYFDIEDALVFDPSKPNGQARKTVVPTDDPTMTYTSIEEGIKKTIKWYINSYGSLRK